VFCPDDDRRIGGASPSQALMRNVGTCRPDAKGEPQVEETARGRVPMRGTGADQPVRAMKPGNSGGAKGLTRPAEVCESTGNGRNS